MTTEPTDAQREQFRGWWETARTQYYCGDSEPMIRGLAFAAYCAGVREGQKVTEDGSWNTRYRDAVFAACEELSEMQAPTMTWSNHAAVVITRHLTPLFRDLRDVAKAAHQNEGSKP